MSYTNRLIKYAKDLEAMLVVQRDAETHRYCVFINLVGYKEQYIRKSINGIGFTIEDACYDLIRKAQGGALTHYITEAEVLIV